MRRMGLLIATLVALAGLPGAGVKTASGQETFPSKTRQACGPSAQINVIPSLPTQDDDVQVSAIGDWYDTCIPAFQSHQIDNNVIRVDAIVDYPPGTGCGDIITPWKFMVDVGKLLTGVYEVNLYITDTFNQVPTALCATKSFTVFTEVSRIYLPIINWTLDKAEETRFLMTLLPKSN